MLLLLLAAMDAASASTSIASSRRVIGVDGGGTHTSVVVLLIERGAVVNAEPSFRVLGTAQGAGCNWNSVGLEAAKGALFGAVRDACEAAGVTPVEADGVVLGLSGVDRPDDIAQVNAWLAELLPDVPSQIHNDAVAALASGTLGVLEGIVLISGTGTIALGFAKDGTQARAAGFGPLLGDRGSGYDIGCSVLAAVVRAHDGRAEPTALTAAVLGQLQLEKVDGLITWAYRDTAWERFAALAPLAIAAAAEGDAAAAEIVRGAASSLASTVRAVAQKLGYVGASGCTVVLSGGVCKSEAIFQLVAADVTSWMPGAQVIRPKVNPAIGAALLLASDEGSAEGSGALGVDH